MSCQEGDWLQNKYSMEVWVLDSRRVGVTMVRCYGFKLAQNKNNGRSVFQQVEQNSLSPVSHFLSNFMDIVISFAVYFSVCRDFFVALSSFLFLLKEKKVLFNLGKIIKTKPENKNKNNKWYRI